MLVLAVVCYSMLSYIIMQAFAFRAFKFSSALVVPIRGLGNDHQLDSIEYPQWTKRTSPSLASWLADASQCTRLSILSILRLLVIARTLRCGRSVDEKYALSPRIMQ